MRSFSFKILYISIFAPSILYLLTLPYMEHFSEQGLSGVIRRHLIVHNFDLLQGKVSLYSEVNRNVHAFLDRDLLTRLGAQIGIRITDPHENVVYPYYEHLLPPFQNNEDRPGKSLGPLFDEKGFARNSETDDVEEFLQRYTDYIQGMRISVSVRIPITSWVGSGLLLFYILLTVTVLYVYYQRSSLQEERRIREMTERLERDRRTITRVESELGKARRRLGDVRSQEEEWLREIERLEKEKASLENELLETMEEQEEQKQKMDLLQAKMNRKEAKKSGSIKEEKVLSERFEHLYRNLEVERKAVEDLARLGDAKMKLQAEEVLKRLNDGDANLKVRRRIGGVERCDAFELGFGSTGRIYYISSQKRRYKILRIGTKSSQNRDLAWLRGRTE